MLTNGLPSLRVGDPGIHAACCGPNTWNAKTGSATVFINGRKAHRRGDLTKHCGGIGQLIEGSPNVIVGDLGGGGGGGGEPSKNDPGPEKKAPPPITKLRVKLLDPDGKGAGNAEIRIQDTSATTMVTDAHGVADYGEVPPGGYAVSVALNTEQHKKSFLRTPHKLVLAAGEKREETIKLEPTVLVMPKLEVEYKVVLFDRKLSVDQPAGEPKIQAEPVYVEVWLEQNPAAPKFDKGAKLRLQGSGAVDFYEEEALTTKVDLSQALPNDKLTNGKKIKLWAVGTAVGLFELTLEPEDSAEPEFVKDKPATLKMGVVELETKLFQWDAANPPVMQKMSNADKIGAGRVLHVQTRDKDHARAKLVLPKIDPAGWPEGTDDHEIVLTDKSSGGGLEIFDAEWDGTAQPLPLKLKKKNLIAGDKVLWIQGKTRSAKPRDVLLDVGLDRPAGGPPKKPKQGGDHAFFTVVEFEKVAPTDQFTTPGAAYDNDKFEVLINIKADGHKIKVKARLRPALKGIPAHFMLAASKDNGLTANTGVAIPAGLEDAAGPWDWTKIDESLKKKDKTNDGDHWHLSAATDDKGEAEVTLELSKIGSDVFYAAVYCGQDPHLARYKHQDPVAGKRKPLLGKRIKVARKLWYQLCKAKSSAAPKPSRTEAAYERISVHVAAGATKLFEKTDLPAALQPTTFYPEWMVKIGGGNDEVAVVGGHNWQHFRNNEATFFPMAAGEVSALKARVLVVDYQWDPKGWTATKQVTTSSKTTEVDMGAKVVKPPLQGNLINVATWKVFRIADRVEVAHGNLTDADILIDKPRTSLNKVKIQLPDVVDPFLTTPPTHQVKVVLELAWAENYLGESRGQHIMAVYDPNDVSDYNDTVSHEMGHSVWQTTTPPGQPKGMPDHQWWNDGYQGVHCSNPTVATTRHPTAYAAGEAAAQTAAVCLMFASGPVPKAGNKFCDSCHHYLLAQDMSTLKPAP